MTAAATIDVAIVGAGPKGFGCLERLVVESRGAADPPLVRVSLHDPAPHPGAGPIYDPTQPSYLLMNFAARHVDVWSRDADRPGGGERSGPGDERLDLVSWLAVHHPGWADADAFVPRRLVGQYLQAAFRVLLAALPPNLQVERIAGVVTHVQRAGGGWWVRHDDAALDRHVDEVMLTIGHGTWSSGGASGRSAGASPWTIAPPYPVTTQLGVDRIPAAATVGVRGFALSFIDTALALTVGRGGRFEGIDGDDPAAAHYRASGTEVARLVPFSRTGLPLRAKPGPALAARADELSPLWERLRGRLRANTGGALLPGLCAALAEAAAAGLRQVLGSVPDEDLRDIDALLSTDRRAPSLRSGDPGPAASAAIVEPVADPGCGARSLGVMRRSVDVATGRRAPDAAWAVGEAWRQAYPVLVPRAGHGGVTPGERAGFDALAVHLERLAFGAPAANLHRMIVLAEAGVLDLGHLRAPRLRATDGGLVLASGGRRTPIDVLVDAVIEPPGITSASSLWGGLLRAGLIRVAPGTRGVEVAADAGCLDAHGRRVPGLAVVGRATEGWVVGNDTLSRTLHDETRRWAQRILGTDRAATMPLSAGTMPLSAATMPQSAATMPLTATGPT